MRPRLRSYGLSSIATRSPGRIRMKFLRMRPETCARAWCLFSSSTLNSALGSVSTTTAITSIASSFDKRSPSIGGDASCAAQTPCYRVPAHTASSSIPRNEVEILASQHPRPVFCDRNRVLEVGADAAIHSQRGPSIGQHLHPRPAGVDHRLDGQHHARLHPRPLAARSLVGNLRVFVHGFADAVTDKLTHNA